LGHSRGEGWLPQAELGLKVKRGGRVCLELGLKEALDLGSIDGVFTGTGSSSGDSIILRAKGSMTVAICPELQPGMILANANGAAQNMVLRSVRGIPSGSRFSPVSEIRFEPGVETEYLFEAYCLDFEKDNPSGSDRLSLRGRVPEPAQNVLAVESPSINAIQLAMWAVTDDISRLDALTKFAAQQSHISEAKRIVELAGLESAEYQLFTAVP